jgi:hypothetical protein
MGEPDKQQVPVRDAAADTGRRGEAHFGMGDALEKDTHDGR